MTFDLSRYRSQLAHHPAQPGDGVRLAVLVPVYAEQPERILRQLDFIAAQEGISPAATEVLYVVNARPEASADALQLNAQVLTTLSEYRTPGTQVLAVDVSSPGLALPECNVGVARQLGLELLHERFKQRGHSGVIVFADADSYLEQKNYLATVVKEMTEDPNLIAIAAGRRFVVDLDSGTDEAEHLLGLLPRVSLYQRWQNFHRIISQGYASGHQKFHGPATIVRSEAALAAGGVPLVAFAEDVFFGERLRNYAAGHGLRVAEMKEALRVTVSLRISARTENQNLKYILSQVAHEVVMVEDPQALGTMVRLTPEACERWSAAVAKLPEGPEFLRFISPGTGSSVVAAVMPDGTWIGEVKM